MRHHITDKQAISDFAPGILQSGMACYRSAYGALHCSSIRVWPMPMMATSRMITLVQSMNILVRLASAWRIKSGMVIYNSFCHPCRGYQICFTNNA
jgi:hypothetical protein